VKKINLDINLIASKKIKINSKNFQESIISLIEQIFSENKDLAEKLSNNPFSFGLWIFSEDYQNKLFKNALKSLNRTQIEYFDPIIFSSSILNFYSSNICKKFNIKGFSCSFISFSLLNLLINFKETNVLYGIFIWVKNTHIEVSVFSKLERRILVKECYIFDNKKEVANFYKDNKICNNIKKVVDFFGNLYKTIKRTNLNFCEFYDIIKKMKKNKFYYFYNYDNNNIFKIIKEA